MTPALKRRIDALKLLIAPKHLSLYVIPPDASGVHDGFALCDRTGLVVWMGTELPTSTDVASL